MTARGPAEDEPLARLTPEECERLWDVFEKLDHAAAQIVFSKADGRTIPGRLLKERLREAINEYRTLRDKLDEDRKDRFAESEERMKG